MNNEQIYNFIIHKLLQNEYIRINVNRRFELVNIHLKLLNRWPHQKKKKKKGQRTRWSINDYKLFH